MPNLLIYLEFLLALKYLEATIYGYELLFAFGNVILLIASCWIVETWHGVSVSVCLSHLTLILVGLFSKKEFCCSALWLIRAHMLLFDSFFVFDFLLRSILFSLELALCVFVLSVFLLSHFVRWDLPLVLLSPPPPPPPAPFFVYSWFSFLCISLDSCSLCWFMCLSLPY